MSFRKYASYKDSGIAWIGKVPAHWEVKKLKYVCSRSGLYGANVAATHYQETGIRFLRTTDITDDGQIKKEGVFLPEELVRDYILNDGDILLSRSGTVGRSFLYQPKLHDPCAYAGYLVRFVPNPHTLPKYVFFFTKTHAFERFLRLMAISATIENVNADKYANAHLPAPPLEEQQKIAAFLDKETVQIDALIDEQTRLISLLREKRQAVISNAVTKGLNANTTMKDSGIEWIGKVPAHWEVKKLKFVARVQPSNVNKKSKENEERIRLCNYTDVYYNEEITADLPFMKATASDAQIRKLTLKKGDIIITKDSEDPNDIAVPAYVPQDLQGVVCGYHLALLRPKDGTFGGFLKRAMDSQYARSFFATRANGITRYGLGIYAINNFILPIPPTQAEQEEIADYLDRETEQIDALIEECEMAIGLLKERRTALISAAVTGAIDVRNVG